MATGKTPHAIIYATHRSIAYLAAASGTRGGRVCALQKCVIPAHPRTRTGRAPLGTPARHHDRPGHSAPSAGALRSAALQADRGLPEGQPPMFTRSPDTGLWHNSQNDQNTLCVVRELHVKRTSAKAPLMFISLNIELSQGEKKCFSIDQIFLML